MTDKSDKMVYSHWRAMNALTKAYTDIYALPRTDYPDIVEEDIERHLKEARKSIDHSLKMLNEEESNDGE